MAIAFIPPVDVISVFEELLDSPFFTDNIDGIRDLLNYFKIRGLDGLEDEDYELQ